MCKSNINSLVLLTDRQIVPNSEFWSLKHHMPCMNMVTNYLYGQQPATKGDCCSTIRKLVNGHPTDVQPPVNVLLFSSSSVQLGIRLVVGPEARQG